MGPIDQEWVEQRLKAGLEPVMGVLARVECPDALEARVGATTRCTATTPGGTRVGVTVTVTKVDDDPDSEQVTVGFDAQVDDTPTSVGHDLLEPELNDLFEAVMGAAPAKVEVLGALEADVGATTRCAFPRRTARSMTRPSPSPSWTERSSS